jgi:hypothetical protein
LPQRQTSRGHRHIAGETPHWWEAKAEQKDKKMNDITDEHRKESDYAMVSPRIHRLSKAHDQVLLKTITKDCSEVKIKVR